MKFRLYYEGELRPTQRDPLSHEPDKIAQHKQAMRRGFHKQLRHLWRTNRFLSTYKRSPKGDVADRSLREAGALFDYDENDKIPLAEFLAGQYSKFGYRFVPLVRDEIALLCSLDILFLRRDGPGSVIQAGDIDDRIKTIIDALRAPSSPNELVDGDLAPGPDEDPFYCLLWDDRQVSHLFVETDLLLDEPSTEKADPRRVRHVITVELRPYDVTYFNLGFAGS